MIDSPGKGAPKTLDVFIEVPKGCPIKYEYDKKAGVLRVDRYMHSAVFYPGDYGYIPGTMAKDGDPLDGIVLVSSPGYPGTVVEVRPIGMLNMEDEKGQDEKLLCVPVEDPRFKEVKSIEDVPEHTLAEIKQFFETYKALEPGKWVKVTGWVGANEAMKVIEEAIEEGKKKQGA